MRQIRLATIALTGAMVVLASTASAQNPFAIDGVVLDNQNSKEPPPADPGAAAKVTDPSTNTKELGPKNGSPQQLGDIHTAPVPMLADTNPNGNNDLNAIWTQVEQDGNNHYWLYYAWSRDTAGTGIIGIELEKEPSGCDYSNLLACNPWGHRSAGDVVFVWDTKGGATDIVKRVFVEQNGVVILPACPQNFPAAETPECSLVESAVAVFSDSVGDDLRGEAAIDLTDEGIIPLNECVTFSNIIPFSGTGNSDSADIKDAVLNQFPPITTCGIVTVKKVLLNLTSLQRDFNYLLNRDGGAELRPGITQIPGTLEGHNVQDTLVDLIPGGDYKLDETAPVPSPFQKVRVFCVFGSTTYTLFDDTPADNVSQFPVVGGQTTACTIENRAVGEPQGSTVQSARLHDQVLLGSVLAHAALNMSATFSLFTTANCSGQPLATGPNNASSFTTSIAFAAAQEGTLTTGLANTLSSVGFGTTGSGTYFWKVVVSGDTINVSRTFCHENTVIQFNDGSVQ